jgi:hypothetical protein
VFSNGDFWAANAGANQVTIGMKAYASLTDGSVTFGATGTPPVGGVVTGSIAAGTAASVTASITGTIMSVTAVGAGVLQIGAPITGTGVVAGTTIVSQLTGAAGGIGTYNVSIPQTVASTTIGSTYGVLTVTGTTSGAVNVGDPISGAGVTAGTVVTAPGAVAGTYIVVPSQTATSTTITATGGIETKWIAMSVGAPGEVIMISAQALG